MAVFEELNKQPKRLSEPKERKAEPIVRAEPKRRKGKSSSVSLDTYRRTSLLISVGVGLVATLLIGGGILWAVNIFIN